MQSSYLAKSTELLLFISRRTKNTTIDSIYLNSKPIANFVHSLFETDLTSLNELYCRICIRVECLFLNIKHLSF